MVPAIDGVDRLRAWWLTEVHRSSVTRPLAGRPVLLPSRRYKVGGVRQGSVDVAELPVDPDPPMPGVRLFSVIPL
ncbi:hypothetical protein [Streptomyces sp. NPDC002692]